MNAFDDEFLGFGADSVLFPADEEEEQVIVLFAQPHRDSARRKRAQAVSMRDRMTSGEQKGAAEASRSGERGAMSARAIVACGAGPAGFCETGAAAQSTDRGQRKLLDPGSDCAAADKKTAQRGPQGDLVVGTCWMKQGDEPVFPELAEFTDGEVTENLTENLMDDVEGAGLGKLRNCDSDETDETGSAKPIAIEIERSNSDSDETASAGSSTSTLVDASGVIPEIPVSQRAPLRSILVRARSLQITCDDGDSPPASPISPDVPRKRMRRVSFDEQVTKADIDLFAKYGTMDGFDSDDDVRRPLRWLSNGLGLGRMVSPSSSGSAGGSSYQPPNRNPGSVSGLPSPIQTSSAGGQGSRSAPGGSSNDGSTSPSSPILKTFKGLVSPFGGVFYS